MFEKGLDGQSEHFFPAQLSPSDPPTIEPTPKWDEQSALAKEFGGGVKRVPPTLWVGEACFKIFWSKHPCVGSWDMDIASNTLETFET